MRSDSVDRLLGLRRIGKIDAAEFDPVRCRRDLRGRMIQAGHARTPRQRLVRNHLSECA